MKIHPRFKLNGKSYSNKALTEVANGLLKDDASYKKAIGEFLLEWLNSSESIIVSTSGSTGNPKKIHLKKEQMLNSAIATGAFFKLKEGDTALLCLPCHFIAGKMMLVRAMVLGLELDYVASSSSPLDNNDKSYDFAAMVPLQATNSIKKLDVIDKLIIGGAPINTELENKLKALKTSIFETYGMTETITHIAVKKLGDSYFKTLPDITLKKDDRECLIIHAPKISNEEVVTNDIVDILSNNSFKWLGRYDNVINSGGVKLIPEQIALKLNRFIQQRFFVIGLPDDSFGEKLVLLVEGEEEPLLLEKIKMKAKLSKFEIPKAIYFLPKFAETKNGKLHRSKTVALFKK